MRRALSHNNYICVKMSNLPPRKISTSSKGSKQDASPLQILLQMGFPRHRALKALAATGNRSVQLASDWLLTHVNDAFIDTDVPREYILYACPTGPLLSQLHDFWEKSKSIGGWNGAHNFPPHITLVSFFKAPDEASLQLGKAVKHVVESVGDAPTSPLKLEPYLSHNFMGLFVNEEHADYLKKIALHFVKDVSSALGVSMDTYEHLDALGTCFPWCTMAQEKPIKSISLEPHVKSLHITLAYHFSVTAFDALKSLVEALPPLDHSAWELRLYSRDPRFANHEVHKVTQDYAPKESDELELVIGDYIYVDEKEIESSPDGWVQGTSWLTGVTGYLPAVYTQRTAEADAWTLHRAISLGNNNCSDSKSESDSTTDGEMATNFPHEDADKLGFEKSEEAYGDWKKYWNAVIEQKKTGGLLDITQGTSIDWKAEVHNGTGNGDATIVAKTPTETGDADAGSGRRWHLVMRHGERVDLTYGAWVPFCFENDTYGGRQRSIRAGLPPHPGGQATSLPGGRGHAAGGVSVRHVYASCAYRAVETAQGFLEGMQADPSVKIRVEPGLFEYKMWHLSKGPMPPFMTPLELHKAGFNVDLNYKPYVEIDLESPETLDDYYIRGKTAMQGAVRDTEAEGGNTLFVGHAATLDMMVVALKNIDEEQDPLPYQLSKHLGRVPYCALGAMRDHPWQVVSPPCPPTMNTSSGRFDWKVLLDL
ncbi:unnamed protein product [Plutella xylostella]|uniref:Ecdysteroid-phosphate phosphatase n=1 Tax=Plutella xylostella TaxID=51655 RepID=A0A8S4DQR3_PLUXY|nr:unnamed protein product [Plutella xylostella]